MRAVAGAKLFNHAMILGILLLKIIRAFLSFLPLYQLSPRTGGRDQQCIISKPFQHLVVVSFAIMYAVYAMVIQSSIQFRCSSIRPNRSLNTNFVMVGRPSFTVCCGFQFIFEETRNLFSAC